MARRRRHDDDDRDNLVRNPSPRRRKRFRKRTILLLGLLFMLVAGTILLPSIATSRSILLPVIDRYAGIAPLKVDFVKVNAGWFSPVSIEGLQLLDATGAPIAKVGSVKTEKGLLSWALSSTNLGTIRISKVDMDVVANNSTTNIEQALDPLLKTAAATPSEPSATTSKKPTGTIELSEVHMLLSNGPGSQVWELSIPTFRTDLPAEGQLIGPTQLSASIGIAPDTGNNVTAVATSPIQATTHGSIAADVAEVTNDGGRSFQVRAALDHVPLGFWRTLRQRVPDLPIEDLNGSVSGRLAGSMASADKWTFNIEQFNANSLQITAPQLVGSKAAQVQSIDLKGKATLADGRLQIDGSQLASDFGSVNATGVIPWPIVMPTMASPYLPGAQFAASGAVDLAKLAQAAETLLPMRDNTRLVSGTARFKANQQMNTAGQPNAELNLELGNLQAIANGQPLQWDQPFKLVASAKPQPDGKTTFEGQCNAEFLNATATGTLTQGNLNAAIDLNRLQQRLAQWFTLPIATMNGNVELATRWNQTQADILDAEGTLKTTQLVIALTSGGELREPAWTGAFRALARMNGNQVTKIDRARLELVAQNDKLELDLLEPLSLASLTQTPGQAINTDTPAAYTLSASGSLELWKQRAAMLKLMDPSIELGGNFTLGASGRATVSKLEVQQANWDSKPFLAGASGVKIAEEQLVGNFEGRVDTSDLTRLAVEKLVVRAGSFAMSAADTASADGTGRDGKGAFVADLQRLMKNVQTSSAKPTLSLPGGPANAANNQVQVSGQVRGDLAWRVNAQSASLVLNASGEQIDIVSINTGSANQRLWNEPQVLAEIKGSWQAATGNVNVEKMQLQAPWITYAGTATVENSGAVQTIRSNGQCLYDAALVGNKLKPYIGDQVQLVGRKTVPVEVNWIRNTKDTNASTFAGLQASTRIGWDQANVVGVEVGQADVPVTISAGRLATAADIPVSSGRMRWDIQSDLNAPQLVFTQKPMVVLENVAITPQMCQSWLKYVTPLLADATSVEGRLSVQINEARFNPANTRDQTIDGQLLVQSANVGPGPLSNQVIGLVQQVNAIRKQQLASAVSSQQVWLQLPQQTIAFRMENGRVLHRNLSFRAGDVNISSSGSVDIDGRIDLAAAMPIPDDWIEKSPWLTGFRGQSLQFPVTGTLTAPRVDTQLLGSLGQGMAQQAVQGALQQGLQQGLSRGLNKLFGAPPPTTQPATPPIGTP